ncbi:hypothetical protein Tco_0269827 [Tanacetum coccineum]
MSSYNHFGCSWCGGPFNGGNCPGCSGVGSENEFVYDPNPYSYNKTPNFFNQPPQHQYETYSCELCGDSSHYGFDFCHNSFTVMNTVEYHIDDSQQFYCCEHCGGPHYGSDCQMVNMFHEHAPYDNHDSSGFDQPSQFTPPQPLPLSELTRNELIKYMIKSQEWFNINQEKLNMNFQAEMNRLHEMLNLINSNQDPPVDLYDLKGSDEGDNEIDSLTKEPLDTLLMGDEVISTTLARENNKFIKSSVYDLVPIPRESKVTLVCDDSEYDMPTPLPTTDVREEDFDINSPLGEKVVDFLMENVDVAGLPRHSVKQLFSHLVKNPSLTKRMSDEPLGEDLKPRSYDEFEDISSLDPPELTSVIDESSLLVTPLPDPKQICLREVERFDPFFSLTQLGGRRG